MSECLQPVDDLWALLAAIGGVLVAVGIISAVACFLIERSGRKDYERRLKREQEIEDDIRKWEIGRKNK